MRVCEGGSECGGDSGCMCVYVIVSVEVGGGGGVGLCVGGRAVTWT